MPTVPLERALAAPDLALLRALGVAANAAGVRLWLVGGAVRDALLERTVTDLDLASAAPARELAPAVAAAVGATRRRPLRIRHREAALRPVARWTWPRSARNGTTTPAPCRP